MSSFAWDAYNQFEKPAFTLANPDGIELFSLGTIYDRAMELRFNALSKLTFTAPSQIDGIATDYYNYIDYRRLVKVENVATFMIREIEKDHDGITEVIKVTCESLETQLADIKISLYKGTKNFYNTNDPSGTLLDDLLKMIPAWSIAYIDPTLLDIYRTFDVTDKSLYDFMMNEVAQTYQCVFTFDSINKTISVYAIDNATSPTDIFLSFNNLIEKRIIKVVSSEISTALTVLGGQNISINQVNPLGGNIIYNFDYFKTTNWMDQSLVDAVTTWENKTAAYQPVYAQLLYDLETINTSLLALEVEMTDFQSQMSVLQDLLDVRKKQGLPHVDIDAQILKLQGDIILKQNQIDAIKISMNSIEVQLTAINSELSFASSFTVDQLKILNSYIIGSTYTNTNFVSYDTTSLSDVRIEAQELYDLAQTVLTKVSQPRYTIEIDAVNFTFLKEFQTFANQLVLGCVVTVDLDNEQYFYPALLEIDFNYDDPTQFKVVFSNRARLDDSTFQYGDLFNRIANITTTTAYNKQQWNTWKGYPIDALPTPTGLVADRGKVPTLSPDGKSYYLLPVPPSAHTIQGAGNPIVPRTNLNFTGTGISVSDDIDNNATTIDIQATSGSGTFGWSFPFNVSGSGTGQVVAGYVQVPYTCTINEAILVGNTSGYLTADIWTTPYTSFPPTAANSICGSTLLSLGGNQKVTNTSLSDWTIGLTGGDWLGIAYSSASVVSSATLSLKGITISGSAGGGSGASLRVKTIDGNTSVPNVSIIQVTNGALTDNGGGNVTLNTSGSSSGGSGTVTQIDTGTGLTGGPITSTGTISLANTAVSPGSYTNTNLTVDQQGRITVISNGTSGSGGSGTVTQINTGTGLTGGPISGSGTISIANTAVTPGSYTNSNITIDQQGRITLASNGTSGSGGSGSSLEVRTISGSPTVSNVNIIKVTNGTLTDNGGGIVTLSISSGSGGGGTPFATVWEPDAPLDTPSSLDDNFDDQTLDGKWTHDGAYYTSLEASYGWTSHGVHSGDAWEGIYQAVPAADWTITSRISLSESKQDYVLCGLLILYGTDLGSLFNVFGMFSFGSGSAHGLKFLAYNDRNTYSSDYYSEQFELLTDMYLRLRYDYANQLLHFDASKDGIGYREMNTAANIAGTVPTKVGVGFNNTNASNPAGFVSTWFRYKASFVDVTDIQGGNRISIYK